MKKFSLVLRKHMLSLTILPLIFLLIGFNASDRTTELEPITQEASIDQEMDFDCVCPSVVDLEIDGHNGYLCCTDGSGNNVSAYEATCEFGAPQTWTWVWVAKQNCTISSNGGPSATVTPTTCEAGAEAIFAVNVISNTLGCKQSKKGKIFRLPIKSGNDCIE